MSCGSCCSSGSGGWCTVCKLFTGLALLVTTLTTIATAMGVFMTHVTPEGWMFGTLNGSLAIVAFLVSVMCWLKLVKKLCPCGKMGGACPGCGTEPCSCK